MRSRSILVFAIVLALITSVAIQPLSRNPLPVVLNAHAINRTISLVGNASGWNFSLPSGSNPTITVNQGDMVTIRLTSVDTLHQFALDLDKDGQKITGSCSTGDQCSGMFTPSSGTSISIDTSTLLGPYTYFCTFHSAMLGSLMVLGGTVGGSTVTSTNLTPEIIYIVLSLIIIAVGAATYIALSRRKTTTQV